MFQANNYISAGRNGRTRKVKRHYDQPVNENIKVNNLAETCFVQQMSIYSKRDKAA